MDCEEKWTIRSEGLSYQHDTESTDTIVKDKLWEWFIACIVLATEELWYAPHSCIILGFY